MPSTVETIEFICDQITDLGEVRYKKMFGEYMAYLNDKPIFLVCNDTLFVKINAVTTALMGADSSKGFPYNGAKEHYIIEDIDNRVFMQKLAIELEKITPVPKPRKKNK